MRLTVSLVLSLGLGGCAGFGRRAAREPAGLPGAGQRAVIFAPGVVSTGDVFASTFLYGVVRRDGVEDAA